MIDFHAKSGLNCHDILCIGANMINGINHITIAVKDIETSFAFYREIMGFKPVVKWKNGAYFNAAGIWFAINQDASIADARRPDYSHIAFNCNHADFERIRSRLLRYGCVEWSTNQSEGASIYFLDPDGHKLKIHAGSLESRLKEMQNNPWNTYEYF